MDGSSGPLSYLKIKKQFVREGLAEFFGTFILTLGGNSCLAAVILGGASNYALAIAPWGWGLSLAMAIYICGGVSGGHVNPAVTLGLASVGKLSWRKVPVYFLAQYLGAFLAAAVVFLVYQDQLYQYDGGERMVYGPNATAGIFASYPAPSVSAVTGFIDQILGAGFLMLSIVAITDERNMSVPKGCYPILIGLALAHAILCFGINCGAPINPARDFSPRLFTAMAGWGFDVFSYRDYNWFWVPILGPHVGMILTAWLYKLFVELHHPHGTYDLSPEYPTKSPGDVEISTVKVYDTKN